MSDAVFSSALRRLVAAAIVMVGAGSAFAQSGSVPLSERADRLTGRLVERPLNGDPAPGRASAATRVGVPAAGDPGATATLLDYGHTRGGVTPVIRVGNDPGGCDYFATPGNNGLQQAINAAANDANGADTTIIRVADSGAYGGRGYNINFANDQDLSIVGGYASCDSDDPSGRTTLDAGGAPDSVIEIGPGGAQQRAVELSNLVLAGGTDDPDDGGGLEIDELNFVALSNVVIENNGSEYGGGIHIDGNGIEGDTSLWILDRTFVRGNAAAVDGGGVYCEDRALVLMDDFTSVNDNQADRDGGGLFLLGCDATLFTSFPGGIYENVAGRHGGGIASQGGTVSVRGNGEFVFGNPAEPAAVDNNRSGQNGGGIYAVFDATLNLVNAIVVGNDAGVSATGLGGGVYMSFATALNVLRSVAAADCHDPVRCSEISFNTADGGGGVWSSGPATVDISQTFFENNAADGSGTALMVNNNGGGPSDRAAVRLEGNVIAGNDADRTQPTNAIQTVLEFQSNADVTLIHNTIADNIVGSAGHLIGGFDNLDIRAYANIFWESQGGVFSVQPWDADTVGQVYCAVAFETSDLPPDNTAVIDADPRFRDPDSGDYHLIPNSPALDFCDQDGYTPAHGDMDDQTRANDWPFVANGRGPYDLGADESFDPTLFADGFEFAN